MSLSIYGVDTIVLPATIEGSTVRVPAAGMARMRKRRRAAFRVVQASSTGPDPEQTAGAVGSTAMTAFAFWGQAGDESGGTDTWLR